MTIGHRHNYAHSPKRFWMSKGDLVPDLARAAAGLGRQAYRMKAKLSPLYFERHFV
jgi:hypothetical protein